MSSNLNITSCLVLDIPVTYTSGWRLDSDTQYLYTCCTPGMACNSDPPVRDGLMLYSCYVHQWLESWRLDSDTLYLLHMLRDKLEGFCSFSLQFFLTYLRSALNVLKKSFWYGL